MESHSIWPKPACLNSQAITSWMRGHVINWEIHDGSAIWNTRGDRQSSLTRPFVTDASTSRRQRVRPYCMRTHRIVHNVSRLSKHYDGETSNENQSFCRDCMFLFWVIGLKWVCVWGGVGCGRSVWVLPLLTAVGSAGFDPTNRSDLNKLRSIFCCLGLKSPWKKMH